MAKLHVSLAPPSHPSERASRLNDGPALQLESHVHAVQFLRGVKSRSWIALAHLYLSMGAKTAVAQPTKYFPAKALSHSLDFSAAATVSLCCRQVFDHGKDGMTARSLFGRSAATLEKVAHYWSERAQRDINDARAALLLLKTIFSPLCHHKNKLRDSTHLLARRVGYLKRHADGQAAHLSMDYYEFDGRDMGHVVAAMVIIGHLIEEFDGPPSGSLDEFDGAAYLAAKSVFPSLGCTRLFEQRSISSVVAEYKQLAPDAALQHLSERLSIELGWH